VVEADDVAAVDVADVRHPIARFDERSVVLLTGGGRGITARVALAIARSVGSHVVLVGRSPLPDAEEDPATRDAVDEKALRATLVDAGIREPRQIEASVRRTLADRELRANLAAISAVAASVTYHQCDVRDADALRALVGHVVDEHGRIDLVVHGAGVLDDRFVRDKTTASFATVFDTKVAGACALVDAVSGRRGADGVPTTVALFASIAGVFGNRGQVDYAAANDALDALAWSLREQPGIDVVAVDWGPWAGGGMVSPELEREYERRGVGLLDPDDAVNRLLAELGSEEHRAEPQVVVMRCSPDALDEPTEGDR
jgi:NAD(P)-dependent dehydrogenase (short-subunit alcohol dehydrogenase family)